MVPSARKANTALMQTRPCPPLRRVTAGADGSTVCLTGHVREKMSMAWATANNTGKMGRMRVGVVEMQLSSHPMFDFHGQARQGLLRELNPGSLAPEARIMPLDQAAK